MSKINPTILGVGSVLAALGVGGYVGYLATKKHYEAVVDEEIATFKAEYTKRHEEHLAAVTTAVRNEEAKAAFEVETIVKERGYVSTSEPPTTKRVFDDAPRRPVWDQDQEEVIRQEASIYIISKEEFGVNAPDNEQEQLTYYEGDDILATNADQIVTEVVATIGDDCLSKFGYGSDNDDIVYIRNEITGCDYEILRTDGKYSEIVLGLGNEEEIRHSSEPRRFRPHHD